jgi:hypothetical protein
MPEWRLHLANRYASARSQVTTFDEGLSECIQLRALADRRPSPHKAAVARFVEEVRQMKHRKILGAAAVGSLLTVAGALAFAQSPVVVAKPVTVAPGTIGPTSCVDERQFTLEIAASSDATFTASKTASSITVLLGKVTTYDGSRRTCKETSARITVEDPDLRAALHVCMNMSAARQPGQRLQLNALASAEGAKNPTGERLQILRPAQLDCAYFR